MFELFSLFWAERQSRSAQNKEKASSESRIKLLNMNNKE